MKVIDYLTVLYFIGSLYLFTGFIYTEMIETDDDSTNNDAFDISMGIYSII